MNPAIRPLLCLFALVWLALGMSFPASAWMMHDAQHGAVQVSVDKHHHHDADGGISIDDHDADRTGQDAPDGGHDHMPSILLGAAAVPDAGLALAAPVTERATFALISTRGVERHGTGGLRRPPKLG